MTPYSRPKLSDLYTPSQSKLLGNLTLHSGTYLHSPYMAVQYPLPPPQGTKPTFEGIEVLTGKSNSEKVGVTIHTE